MDAVAALGGVQWRRPAADDRVYKAECAYCSHTPLDQGGLFVCLRHHVAVCGAHAAGYADARGQLGYVHYWQTRVPVEPKAGEGRGASESKVSKLAINVAGGFHTGDGERARTESHYAIVTTVPPAEGQTEFAVTADVGQGLYDACMALIGAEDALHRASAESAANVWGGDERPVTEHAYTLTQVASAPRIAAAGPWKCADCELAANLWLNLTDGTIRCGRKQWTADGGSGTSGNEHSKHNWERKRDCPLAVKLGTISATGGDVYSYDEDTEVAHPNLAAHLAHFGLVMGDMSKSELSMDELQIELNMKADLSAIQEEGVELRAASGDNVRGIVNLGSSCYINAVLQCLAVVPAFRRLYVDKYAAVAASTPPRDVFHSVNMQTAKLLAALCTDGRRPFVNGVRPLLFRRLVGGTHAEFSTYRQQDAEEYVRHLFDKLEAEPAGGEHATDAFRFKVEERLCDVASGRVRCSRHDDLVLSLAVPPECVTNAAEVADYERRLAASRDAGQPAPELVRPKVPLAALLRFAFTEDLMPDHASPVTGDRTGVSRSSRPATFPDYLWIHVRRFTVGADKVTPRKLPVMLVDTERVDIGEYRASGVRPGEVEMAGGGGGAPAPPIADEAAAQLEAMGFGGDFVAAALRQCTGGDTAARVQRALDLLLSGELVPMETAAAAPAVEKKCTDGSGAYELLGLVSHMGENVQCGHYVAHVRKATDERPDGAWILFNDEKASYSQAPPYGLGYMYLYKRI